MDHFVLVGLDVFEDIFTFEVLDCEEGRVERDSHLVENWDQRSTEQSEGAAREMRARRESGNRESREAETCSTGEDRKRDDG